MRFKAFTCFSMFFITPICATQPLHFCMSEWPPHEFTSAETRQIEGTTVALVKKTLEHMGQKFDLESMPFERCTAMVKNGSKHALFSLSKNAERDVDFIFASEPLKAVGYNIVVLNENVEKVQGSWRRSQDLKQVSALLDKEIGSPQGYSATKKAINAGARVDGSATDDVINFRKLLGGRVGAILIEPSVFKALKKRFGTNEVTLLEPAFVKPKNYYVAFTRSTSLEKDFPAKFSKALAKVKQKG